MAKEEKMPTILTFRKKVNNRLVDLTRTFCFVNNLHNCQCDLQLVLL